MENFIINNDGKIYSNAEKILQRLKEKYNELK